MHKLSAHQLQHPRERTWKVGRIVLVLFKGARVAKTLTQFASDFSQVRLSPYMFRAAGPSSTLVSKTLLSLPVARRDEK